MLLLLLSFPFSCSYLFRTAAELRIRARKEEAGEALPSACSRKQEEGAGRGSSSFFLLAEQAEGMEQGEAGSREQELRLLLPAFRRKKLKGKGGKENDPDIWKKTKYNLSYSAISIFKEQEEMNGKIDNLKKKQWQLYKKRWSYASSCSFFLPFLLQLLLTASCFASPPYSLWFSACG
uniref:hypothetical protein 18 n=1 Tax=Moniliophthora perniciosa TaxID=153609 RepID=UPI0000242352|nr:hypothetical protein 18 [Moniliophthora perniciosa]AAQ74308.1 hypothetical protein 18 [Moniliophthora perniciosa]